MVSGQSPDQDMEFDDALHHPSTVHTTNPDSVQWLHPVYGHPGFYESVLVDGVEYSVGLILLPKAVSNSYQVGDAVMVVPGEDEDAARAKCYKHQPSQSANKLGNDFW